MSSAERCRGNPPKVPESKTGQSVSFDAASEGESAQFGAGPAGQEQPGDQVAYGGAGVDFLGGEAFGGQQGAEAVVAAAP